MKKLIIPFGLLVLPIVAGASSMCVHSDSYVATLSISRDGESMNVGSDGTFTVTFGYYTSSRNTSVVNGIAACNEISGTDGVADETLSTAPSDTGQNCWCAMKRPLVSKWVNAGSYASNAACASACTTTCATRVKDSSTFRSAMFQAIW